jgi:hypothetical protein
MAFGEVTLVATTFALFLVKLKEDGVPIEVIV